MGDIARSMRTLRRRAVRPGVKCEGPIAQVVRMGIDVRTAAGVRGKP